MVPPFVRKATDSILEAGMEDLGNSSALNFIYWIIGFALLRGLFMYLMRQTIVVTSRYIERDLRAEVMKMTLGQNQSFFSRYSVGDMMNRMSEDINQVRTFCGPVIMYLVNTFSMITMVVIIMFRLSPMLSVWVLFPLPFLAIIIFRINSRIYQNSVRIQETLSDMTALNQESFSNAKMIKALNAEKWTLNLFHRSSSENKKQNIRLAQLKAWYFPLVQFFISLSILLAIYMGSNQVIDGKLSYGNIAEFVLYINMIMFPIGSLGWVFAEFERALSSMDRISEVMAYAQKEREVQEVLFEKSIETRDLNYRFPGESENTLKKVNLRFGATQKYLLIGKIGSGKTLLMSLILGMREAEDGQVLVDGCDIKDIDINLYRKQIALVPQEPVLFSDTIENNVKFYNQDISQERYEQVLRDCEIWDEIQKFPAKDQTIIGEKGVLLSGGQKQRISLARAIIDERVNLFLLDDPFSAVDIENEVKIWNKLSRYFENKTIIFIANKISQMSLFDEVILMDDGAVVAQGTPEKMREEVDFFANMLL